MSNGRYERELRKHLENNGYIVVRAPASGAGADRPLPDLFWSRPTETAIAAELKTRKEDIAYLSKDEIDALSEFAAAFNANPRIILRVKQDTSYYVIDPKDGHETENSIRVEKEDAYTTIEP